MFRRMALTLAAVLAASAALATAGAASAKDYLGVACKSPPPEHCNGDACQASLNNPGTAVDPRTGRKYWLDYPCDLKPGYVWDYARQGYKVWGMKARPGFAKVWVYPKCSGGRVVADVERMDKGHTEGLEPHVTEAIVKLMVAAPGGKISGAEKS